MNQLIQEVKKEKYANSIDRVREIESVVNQKRVIEKCQKLLGVCLFASDEFDNVSAEYLAASAYYTAELLINNGEEVIQDDIEDWFDISKPTLRRHYHNLLEEYEKDAYDINSIICPECGDNYLQPVNSKSSLDFEPPDTFIYEHLACLPGCGAYPINGELKVTTDSES